MTTWLAPAHLALSLIILVWDVVLAGRIAQLREAPRGFANITGLAALLIVPALLIQVASATMITGRGVASTDWIWPAILVLFAFQGGYALVRRLVNPVWGIPIFAYNALIATVGVVRFFVAHGYAPVSPLLVVMSAQSTAMSIVTWSSLSMITPFYLNIPMIAPAFPALRRTTAAFRLFMTMVAVVWVMAIGWMGMLRAVVALRLDSSHAADQLRGRPKGDFQVGLKIFPDIAGVPSIAAVRNDLALIDTVDADAISLVVVPGASRQAIDSIGKILDRIRGDSTTVIVAIGYHGILVPELERLPLNAPERLETVTRVVARLRPTILLPAEDPYGIGARVLGDLPPTQWERYLTDAAAIAKKMYPVTKIGVSIARYGNADTQLYAWASSSGSPIDIVGFSLLPSRLGLSDIQDFERAADRLMKTTPSTKEHWVFASGGYPLAYGESARRSD